MRKGSYPQKIVKSFKCDDKTIRDVLKFPTESELSARIRQTLISVVVFLFQFIAGLLQPG